MSSWNKKRSAAIAAIVLVVTASGAFIATSRNSGDEWQVVGNRVVCVDDVCQESELCKEISGRISCVVNGNVCEERRGEWICPGTAAEGQRRLADGDMPVQYDCENCEFHVMSHFKKSEMDLDDHWVQYDYPSAYKYSRTQQGYIAEPRDNGWEFGTWNVHGEVERHAVFGWIELEFKSRVTPIQHRSRLWFKEAESTVQFTLDDKTVVGGTKSALACEAYGGIGIGAPWGGGGGCAIVESNACTDLGNTVKCFTKARKPRTMNFKMYFYFLESEN